MKHKALLTSFAVMVLWGLLFPLVKVGYSAFQISAVGDILTFAGVRFLVCGAIITVFALIRAPKSFSALKSAWPGVLLSGLFAIILHYAKFKGGIYNARIL